MTFWTYFFILVGVLSLTYQLFRLVEFLEHPAAYTSASRPARSYSSHSASRNTYSARRHASSSSARRCRRAA